MKLAWVKLLDCVPAGEVGPGVGSRTAFNARSDNVTLELRNEFVLINGCIGIPLSRVVRWKVVCDEPISAVST